MSVHLPLFSSLAHSISVYLLTMRPFSGPQQAGVIKQAMPTQLLQLPYGRAGWPKEIHKKKKHLSDRNSFDARYNKNEETTPTARPRCLVDRALHRPVEHATSGNSPGTTGQSTTHLATYRHSRPTRCLLITRQPCSLTTGNIAVAGPVT